MSEKTVTIRGRDTAVSISRQDTVYVVRSGERSDRIEVLSATEGQAALRINGRRVVIPYLVDGTSIQFVLDGETHRAEVVSRGETRRGRHREHSMSAPMPAVVLKISVAVGDVVTRGAPLLVLEAMKMEHQIVAPYDGTVREIHCTVGELVQPGVDLVSLEASEK